MPEDTEKLLQLIKEKVRKAPQGVTTGPKGVVVTYKNPIHLNSQEEATIRQLALRLLKKNAEVEYTD